MSEMPQKAARKDASLTMRITRETREALDARALEMGLSVSRVAELWLTDAASGQSSINDRLGTGGVAEALLAMADFAAVVAGEMGDPSKTLTARDALLAGWESLIARALPFTPDTPEGAVAHLAALEARGMVDALFEAVTASGPESGAAAWLVEARAEREGGGLLGTAKAKGRPLLILLSDYSRQRPMGQTDIADIIGLLGSAPDAVANLAPRPADVAKAIQDAHEKLARYMAPRQQARAKGELLAAACTASAAPRPAEA